MEPKQLMKSFSTKEPSFREFQYSPSRFSTSSVPGPDLYPSTSPSHSLFFSEKSNTTHNSCVSSVLKKDGRILSIALLGRLIYTGSDANVIRIWKLPELTECGQLRSNASMVCALAVSDDRVFAASADCKIRIWDRQSRDEVLMHVRTTKIPRFARYIRNFMAGKDRKVKHLGPITSLAINVCDELLYSASVDSTVKVWRTSDLRCIETIKAHSEAVNAVVVGEDGMLYTASDDATIRVWRRNPCTIDRLHALAVTLPTRSSPVKALALTTDGTLLYGGCTDGYLHCWIKGSLSGHLQYHGPLQGHQHVVTCIATFENYVASGSADSTCRIWIRDGHQHTCIAVLVGHKGPVKCVATFSRVFTGDTDDGCVVCTGSVDGTLKLWHVTSSGNISEDPLQEYS